LTDSAKTRTRIGGGASLAVALAEVAIDVSSRRENNDDDGNILA